MENKNVIRINLKTLIIIVLVIIILVGIFFGIVIYNIKKEENVLEEAKEQDTKNTTIVEENTIDSVKIRYGYVYNIATLDDLNSMKDYIDELKIELQGEDLIEVKELLKEITYEEINEDWDNVYDAYELTINDDIILYFGHDNEYAICEQDGEQFLIEIPVELTYKIYEIVEEEVQKEQIEYEAEKITITSFDDNKSITITDEYDIKLILDKIIYKEVNITDDEMEDEEIYFCVDLNNGIQIYLYKYSWIGYISNENDESGYVILLTSLDSVVEEYISGLNEEFETESAVVYYLGESYVLSDEVIEQLIDILKISTYDKLSYEADMLRRRRGCCN